MKTKSIMDLQNQFIRLRDYAEKRNKWEWLCKTYGRYLWNITEAIGVKQADTKRGKKIQLTAKIYAAK